MPRPYINVEHLWEVVQKRKAAGETYRQIAQSYGLKMSQIKKLLIGSIAKHALLSMAMSPEARDAHASHQIPNPLAKRNLLLSVCRWNCSKIFCPRLEGGETQISCH